MPTEIPIACSLSEAERPERAALLERLGAELLSVEARGSAAALVFSSARADDLESFVASESSCCPFFDLDITEAGDEITLSVGAPEDADWAVRGLVAGFVAGWQGLL